MIKTTPPGKGSNLIYLRNTDPVISNLTASKNNIYFAQVGAYQAADAGIHCYHNNLGALELFLSHLNDKPDDLVIIDMVAGVDAFATSLYHQIDIFLFVAEPIIESIHVGQNFIHLAEQNGIKHKIRTIGNKIEDETDREFLKTHLPIDVFIPNTSTIKQIRRRLQPIDFKILEAWDEPLRKISTYINSCSTDHNEILPLLHALHIRQARKASVIAEHGDITDQIDPTFKYS
jgi:CO dehydrogenase maturation factor